jgi:hypothetical protein
VSSRKNLRRSHHVLALQAVLHRAVVLNGLFGQNFRSDVLVHREAPLLLGSWRTVTARPRTPFTLACLREAKRQRALTIGVANNRDTPILEEAEHPIWVDTGAEPIAGSTRMKAGTAQRITLNIFSSLVMILLGRVYEGLMVNIQAANRMDDASQNW